jgi:2-polyprenyl-6-methoxyphenol hydroxylase-like FAD-dependent oxidoreductase
MAQDPIAVRCCIAGGGPAGMMLGLLLARRGVDVLVLEKHADFLRDFRGDTIHPSTLEIMHELGLLDAFLSLPHDEVQTVGGQIGDASVTIADFRHLPTRCKFLALMPQWDFLNFLLAAAKRYPNFRLLTDTVATDLIEERDRIAGLSAQTGTGRIAIRADLVVAADGRHSVLRAKAGLEVMSLGAPMDVLWMRLSRRPSDQPQTLGRIDAGRLMVMLNRGSYWQCAFVIRKGGFEAIREQGLPAFRDIISRLVPWLGERPAELSAWNDIKLLTVAVDRLRRWYRPGLLCIGDAAHAMSPIGGVGINLAIQDAVATANILAPVLSRGAPGESDLAAVQRRRLWPTAMTQRLQVLIQDRVITRILAGSGGGRPALVVRLLQWFPILRRLPARLLGLGFRPEHIR